MATTGTQKKTKKISTKKSKDFGTSSVIIKKNMSDESQSGVSVITKTTNPGVIIQSESVNNEKYMFRKNGDGHKLLRSICLITMCVVLLLIFFISLKTYHIVSELGEFIL